MRIIERVEKVGADGTLTVTIPIGTEAANRDVRITVEPLQDIAAAPSTPEEWQQFIRETAGSIPDPTFMRWPQGKLEERQKLP